MTKEYWGFINMLNIHAFIYAASLYSYFSIAFSVKSPWIEFNKRLPMYKSSLIRYGRGPFTFN